MVFRPILATIFAIGLSLAMAVSGTAQAASKKSNAKSAPKETPATGSGPQLVAQYGDWGVYVSNAKNKVCYALSEPKSRAPKLSRDPGYFFVSTRPSENVRDEVSIVVGFEIKDGMDAALNIGGADYPLYTKNDSAWLKNAAEEGKLIDAMRKGHDLTVKSTSTRGNVTTDRYALSGISQALDRAAQECK